MIAYFSMNVKYKKGISVYIYRYNSIYSPNETKKSICMI